MTDADAAAARADTDRGSAFAQELERDRAHRERSRSLKPLRSLAPYVLRYRGLLAAFAVFLLLASALTLALPAAFRLLIDCGFGGGDATGCQQLAQAGGGGVVAAGLAVAVLLGLATALRFYFISQLGERVVADIRKAVFDKLLALDASSYARLQSGELLSRLTTDTSLIQTVIGSSVSIALRTVITSVGALILMAATHPVMALMVMAIGPAILLPVRLFSRRVQRLSRASQDDLAAVSARAGEIVRAMDTVQAYTREAEEAARFRAAVEQTFATASRRNRVRAAMTATIFSIALCALIGVIAFGVSLVARGAVTAGQMAQFVMYAFVAVSGAGMLSEVYSELMRAAGASERLVELMGMEPALAAPQAPLSLPTPVRGTLGFHHVGFRYPQRPDAPVLDDISLTIAPGETVAFVGPSGGGKSTLFKLLLRLYDPVSGQITLDGAPINRLDPEMLRRQFALVSQSPPLFTGSVLENIQFGGERVSEADAIAAAKAANADGFIRALPDGYATVLGEDGRDLSGGQRQRLAIARAIVRQAPILLLDEATSALDSESERLVQDAIERLSKGRTTLVIAHRLATVRNADRICVIDQGRLVDTGDHDALMARGGLYADYIRQQAAPSSGPAA